MNPKTVLKYATDQGAKFVSVRFTDLPGSWQHLTFPIGELAESLRHDGGGGVGHPQKADAQSCAAAAGFQGHDIAHDFVSRFWASSSATNSATIWASLRLSFIAFFCSQR